MRNGRLKTLLRTLFFPAGSSRRVALGPLRGMSFRVGPITGLSAWYSGAERDHQRAFREILKPGCVAIDVGANWGLHTLYLSRLVGEVGLVLALEPFPPAFAELEWHLAANGCRNVRALQVALSSSDGQATFIPGESAYTGSLSFDGRMPQGNKGIPVATRTLDSLLGEVRVDRLDLIKIDVEGAEGQVLRGAGATVDRFRPTFIIDLHTPEQDVEVAGWLTQRGYNLKRLSGPPITQPDKGWPEKSGVWGSIMACPAGGSAR